MIRIAVILAVFTTVNLFSLAAQDSDRLHEFTSKAGKKVIAELLAISEGQRMMKIRRQDGVEFELEIVDLCLDDQQYVKVWMETRPEPTATTPPEFSAENFRIEIEADKKVVDSKRNRDSYYTYESKKYQYTITVRNISRETLPETKVQYLIVWNEALNLSRGFDGDWGVDYSRRDPGGNGRLGGEKEIETLAFNREAELITDVFSLESMSYSREVYREDKLIGIIVRVLAPDGSLIAEERLGINKINDVSWEARERDPRPGAE